MLAAASAVHGAAGVGDPVLGEGGGGYHVGGRVALTPLVGPYADAGRRGAHPPGREVGNRGDSPGRGRRLPRQVPLQLLLRVEYHYEERAP